MLRARLVAAAAKRRLPRGLRELRSPLPGGDPPTCVNSPPQTHPPAPVDPPTPAPSEAKAFAAKATSYGVALLLIYITAAVLFAMVSMPFKQVGRGGQARGRAPAARPPRVRVRAQPGTPV